MTANLFAAQTIRHDWQVIEIPPPVLSEWLENGGSQASYDLHNSAIKSAGRFIKDALKELYPEEKDTLFDALFVVGFEHRKESVKEGKYPVAVIAFCKRYDRGNQVFRDYIDRMVGRM